MTTYVYQPIKVWGSKNLPCPVCGRKARRQITFQQTLNPFNLSKETGLPKTSAEIYVELHAQRDEWCQRPATHEKCLGGTQ